MISNIDETRPNTGIDQPVQVVRDNFAIAKTEIESLQVNKIDKSGDNMLGVLQLQQVATVDLPSPAANTSGILYNVDTSSVAFSNGLEWINIASGGDLLSTNNLNDVVNTQTSIDNLTVANTVTVDILRLVDHGSNAQMWAIEEDSASPTNAMVFDYAGVERFRIAPDRTITVGRIVTDDGGVSTNLDLVIDPKGTGNVIISNLVYPNTDGSLAQFITTDGFGNLSFAFVAISADTTPQLGGNLDVSGNSIVSVSNGDISITPDGAGQVVLDGLNWPSSDGSPGDVMTTNGTGNLSFTTPPVVDTSVLAFRIDGTPGPAPTTILPTDGIVILASGAPAQVVDLPPAGVVPPGKTFTFTKGLGTSSAIILPSGGDIIDPFGPGPEVSLLFSVPSFGGGFKSVTLVSDGATTWFVTSTGY